ncbi:MAG: hypothetical protein ABSH50_32665 [Bryobacteraceae bacterium]
MQGAFRKANGFQRNELAGFEPQYTFGDAARLLAGLELNVIRQRGSGNAAPALSDSTAILFPWTPAPICFMSTNLLILRT